MRIKRLPRQEFQPPPAEIEDMFAESFAGLRDDTQGEEDDEDGMPASDDEDVGRNVREED